MLLIKPVFTSLGWWSVFDLAKYLTTGQKLLTISYAQDDGPRTVVNSTCLCSILVMSARYLASFIAAGHIVRSKSQSKQGHETQKVDYLQRL